MQLPKVDVDALTARRIEARALAPYTWWDRVFLPTAASLLAAAQVLFAVSLL